MFCPKCGSQVGDTAKFCPKCGHGFAQREGVAPAQEQQVAPTSPPAYQPPTSGGVSVANASSGFDADKVFAVIGIVLVLATFLPWVSLNAYIVGGQYSLLDLVNLVINLNNTAGELLSFSTGTTQALGTITAITVGAVVLWIGSIAALIVGAVRGFKGSGGFPASFAIVAVLAILVILAVMMVSSALGASAAGVLSATVWPWIVALGGLACFIVQVQLHSKKKA